METLIVVLGPTATGKTAFAAHLAARLNGEVVSADSRQVYRGMSIGTGKDLEDYIVEGKEVPYHLIDLVDPGYEYNVFEFRRDFQKAYEEITGRGKTVVLCGGTGMYIESVLRSYRLDEAPENPELRQGLNSLKDSELTAILESYKNPHNTTDTEDRKRLIRAIEIQEHLAKNPEKEAFGPPDYILFGIHFDRQTIRQRISERLNKRLESGMTEEVRQLLDSGISPEQLRFYGLEYRFLTDYLTGCLEYKEMAKKLEIAIHQFAKRQMTWFRRMERQGMKIHWIDGNLPMDEKVSMALKQIGDR